jgi:hypothetical protein
MKKILYILCFLLTINTALFAQDDEGGGAKIRERMTEYIQKRLGLNSAEAERFGPEFLNYFNELRKTNQDFKSDRLRLQQKVSEVRVNYRDKFRPIIGDKRSNDVFLYERDFIDEVKRLRAERQQNQNDVHFNKNIKTLLP